MLWTARVSRVCTSAKTHRIAHSGCKFSFSKVLKIGLCAHAGTPSMTQVAPRSPVKMLREKIRYLITRETLAHKMGKAKNTTGFRFYAIC